MNDDHLKRLRRMLEQVDPTGDAPGLKERLERRVATTEKWALESRGVGGDDLETESALETLDVLRRDKVIGAAQRFDLEAIVMPYHRPVVDIVQDRMKADQLTQKWQHLADASLRSRIEQCLLSIGRIDVPDMPSLPYAGTGFIVGPDLLMTNRHVAQIFAQGIGIRNLRFQSGQSARVDFYHENGRNEAEVLVVEGVVMIHPYWDMALLRVSGLPTKRPPLALSITDPTAMIDREVVVVGYPGYDPRGDDEFQRIQNRIFRGSYYVKRLQPGLLRARYPVESYKHKVQAVTHDSSTLGGNSGSAVLVVPRSPEEDVQVIGLHFAGKYLVANYAVPSADLAQDSQIVDAGVNFVGRAEPRGDFYGPCWQKIDVDEMSRTPLSPQQIPEVSVPPLGAVHQRPTPADAMSWIIPIEVSVRVGQPATRPALTAGAVGQRAAVEGMFRRQMPVPTCQLPYLFSAVSLAATRFDWKTALSSALASRLAYEDPAAIQATAHDLWGMETCQFLEADDTQCFIASTPQAILVAFRGTASVEDLLTDLNVVSCNQPYGHIHRGFLHAFQAVEPRLLAVLKTLPDRPLLLTGHSLGGALATVAAAEWNERFNIARIATFGQPAVGKGNFVAFMGRYLANFIRFVNNDDVVARVPPGYRHVGRLIHFDAAGNVLAGTEAPAAGDVCAAREPFDGERMLSEAEFDRMRAVLLQQRAQRRAVGLETLGAPVVESLLPSFSDHRLDAYIQKIAAQV